MQRSQVREGWPNVERHGWMGADLNKAEVTTVLKAPEIAALRERVERLRATGAEMSSWTAQDCYCPTLAAVLDPAASDLRWGKGLAIVKGIPVEGEALDDIRALYWVVGTYFGDAESQNKFGDRMVDVRLGSNAVSGRAYASAGALALHSDRIDMLSLLSVRRPREGGESIFASSLTVYEIVAQERPDLLPVLERGFRQSRNGEQHPDDESATPYRVPVFAVSNGLRSVLRSANASRPSAARPPVDPLTVQETEALNFLNDVLERKEIQAVVELEVGEAAFMNNYEILHGRTPFTDHEEPERKRHLMRLWLAGRPWRPLADHQRVVINRSGRQGIDPNGR